MSMTAEKRITRTASTEESDHRENDDERNAQIQSVLGHVATGEMVADGLQMRRPEQLGHCGNDSGYQIARECSEALQRLWRPIDVRWAEEAVPNGVCDEDPAGHGRIDESLDHIARTTYRLAPVRTTRGPPFRRWR